MEWIIGGIVLAAAAPVVIEGFAGLTQWLFQLLLGIAGILGRSAITMTERQAILARASYGAVILYVAIFGLDELASFAEWMPEEWLSNNWQVWARIVLLIWGGAWLIIGCGWRGRGDRDGRLISRYAVKIGFGVALFYQVDDPPYDWLAEPIRLLMIWCLITGGVKLVLVLRGLLKPRNKPPAPPPVVRGHGTARIATIQKGEENRARHLPRRMFVRGHGKARIAAIQQGEKP